MNTNSTEYLIRIEYKDEDITRSYCTLHNIDFKHYTIGWANEKSTISFYAIMDSFEALSMTLALPLLGIMKFDPVKLVDNSMY